MRSTGGSPTPGPGSRTRPSLFSDDLFEIKYNEVTLKKTSRKIAKIEGVNKRIIEKKKPKKAKIIELIITICFVILALSVYYGV